MLRGGFIQRAKCPKCGGRIYLDSDQFGWYEQCIVCGYTKDLARVTRVEAEAGDKYAEVPAEDPMPIK